MSREQDIIKEHFYHSDKELENKTKKYLLDNFQIEPECPSHEKDFEDNHIGRRRDNRYNQEDIPIDEWYEQP